MISGNVWLIELKPEDRVKVLKCCLHFRFSLRFQSILKHLRVKLNVSRLSLKLSRHHQLLLSVQTCQSIGQTARQNISSSFPAIFTWQSKSHLKSEANAKVRG